MELRDGAGHAVPALRLRNRGRRGRGELRRVAPGSRHSPRDAAAGARGAADRAVPATAPKITRPRTIRVPFHVPAAASPRRVRGRSTSRGDRNPLLTTGTTLTTRCRLMISCSGR